MKVGINTASVGSGRIGGFGVPNGTLTGPLYLAGNPVSLLEAAPKQYVDNIKTTLSVSNLTSGTIPTGRLPAMSGDASNTAGSDVLTLAASGVTAGTYPKVVTDAKGRVTSGTTLVATDVPSLDWSKIGSGKPTTLSGYGISDGVNLTGRTLTGFLTLHANPTSSLQIATKSYIDTALSAVSGLAVGDVIRKPYATTPSGFLKCNGAYVSQSTYSGLFAVIGNSFDISKPGVSLDYTSYSSVGDGKPWVNQYNINTTQSSDITGWTNIVSTEAYRTYTAVIVTKNRVYMFGGYNPQLYAHYSSVTTAPINADGTIGTWTAGTALPVALSYTQAIVTKNKVYLLGGRISGAASSNTYTAPINADGTLGTWSSGTSLPAILEDSQAVVTKNRVYLIGGYNNNGVSNVFTAPIDVNGTIGVWTSGTSLPTTIYAAGSTVIKNRVYILGGSVGSTTASSVYTAIINNDGTLGTWTRSGDITSSNGMSPMVITTKNRIYFANNTTVYSAPINTDGTLGTWTAGTSIPNAIQAAKVIVTKNRVYLLGWFTGSNLGIMTAPILGGVNDYSSFYDGSINLFDGNSPSTTTNPSPTTQFGLPDLTTKDTSYPGSYSYIKV